MEFLCPSCDGNAFFLHSTLDSITLAQCIQCGTATRFEQSAMTGLRPVSPDAAPRSSGTVRDKLHLNDKV